MDITEFTKQTTAIAAVLAIYVMVMVQAVKKTKLIPKRFIVLVAIVIGVCMALLLAYGGMITYLQAVFAGLLAGGAASGVYNVSTGAVTTVKNVVKGNQTATEPKQESPQQ